MNRKTISIAASIVTLLVLAGCEGDVQTGDSTKLEMTQTESNQQRLAKAIPPPQLKTSLERKNLVKRLERLNTENTTSYVYLVSYGKIMAFYTVDGKVSSLNSYLTTPQQIVSGSDGVVHYNQVLESPDFDGSYGKNADGIFFFTTEGVYVEWQGEYLWSDQPLKLAQPPELIYQLPTK